ncbi:hypothetical protein [Streptomyces sp. NPDC002232]|uniref:hypothetical protein n=1 Tax=Streptomyces sp. NPDC002232 TaxID=3364640 RepID=UPI0036922199
MLATQEIASTITGGSTPPPARHSRPARPATRDDEHCVDQGGALAGDGAVQPADRGVPAVPGAAAQALDPLLPGGPAGVMADAGGADADVPVAEEVADALDHAVHLFQHVVAARGRRRRARRGCVR